MTLENNGRRKKSTCSKILHNEVSLLFRKKKKKGKNGYRCFDDGDLTNKTTLNSSLV